MTSPSREVPSETAPPELLRVIAHELRQPLSTIGSIAYYLTLILPHEDAKVHEQLLRLQQLVEQSSWILTNGQQLTDASEIAPEPIDIEEVVTQTLSMRSGAGDVPLQLLLAGDLPPVEADPGAARALVENVLTLFRLISSAEHPTTLKTIRNEGGVLIEISTAAPGFRSEAVLGPGATLCLECARRTVREHGGTLDLTVNSAAGVRLVVVLPSVRSAVLP